MAETKASKAITAWLEAKDAPDGPHTQGVLAARISERVGRKIPQSTISQIAGGKQMPRTDLAAAFHVELGIEIDWWLPEPSQSSPVLPGSTGTEG